MNYLAHATLSFNNDPVLVGNMTSDYIKGKQKFDFPDDIQKGIMLHRMIDTYTDTHTATKEAVKIFKPVAGNYAPVFTDVVYDHFLAKDQNEFPGNGLEIFAEKTYSVLHSYSYLLPERFKAMLPYMSSQNWLLNYRNKSGIESSFNNIFKRAKYLEKNEVVFNCFNENYELLQKCYSDFFPDVKMFAREALSKMMEH